MRHKPNLRVVLPTLVCIYVGVLHAKSPSGGFILTAREQASLLDRSGGVFGNSRQAIASSAPTVSVAEPGVQTKSGPTPSQKAWLKAADYQRIKIAEQIGEIGARQLSESNGWITLLEEGHNIFPQGPDQIYQGQDGTVHVVEAKGGSSQLGHAYGYRQGTPEWAVKSAERLVKSKTATEPERWAAKQVLEAAAKGKLEVHVIRTPHVLGEAMKPTLVQSLKCTEQASQLAVSSLDRMTIESSLNVTKSSVTPVEGQLPKVGVLPRSTVSRSYPKTGRGSLISRGLQTAGKTTGEWLGRAGIVALIVTEGYLVHGIATGRMTNREFVTAQSGVLGGAGGAWAGAEGGAALGALVPPPFDVVTVPSGAIIGGFAGGISGATLGEMSASGLYGRLDTKQKQEVEVFVCQYYGVDR